MSSFLFCNLEMKFLNVSDPPKTLQTSTGERNNFPPWFCLTTCYSSDNKLHVTFRVGCSHDHCEIIYIPCETMHAD